MVLPKLFPVAYVLRPVMTMTPYAVLAPISRLAHSVVKGPFLLLGDEVLVGRTVKGGLELNFPQVREVSLASAQTTTELTLHSSPPLRSRPPTRA